MKILLPDSLPLNPSLPAGVTAVTYDARAEIPAEHRDAEILVVWANRLSRLRASAPAMRSLRWVQALSAGTDYLADMFDRNVVITSGVGLHDQTVTEHTLALTLALLRRLPEAAQAQAEHRWGFDIGGNQPLRPKGRVTSLIGARVLIWGFGSIGQHLAPVLASLGAQVRGVARSAGVRAGFDVITSGAVSAALAETDVLIVLLPATPTTVGALGRAEIDALPNHAFVVNVGRGATVNQDELITALREQRLAGAALDVTIPEPLPADSPLWDAPNLIITPHAAGGRPVGADELISANLNAFLAGTGWRSRVER